MNRQTISAAIVSSVVTAAFCLGIVRPWLNDRAELAEAHRQQAMWEEREREREARFAGTPDDQCFRQGSKSCPVGFFSDDPFVDELSRELGMGLVFEQIHSAEAGSKEQRVSTTILQLKRIAMDIPDADWESLTVELEDRFHEADYGDPESWTCVVALGVIREVVTPVFEGYTPPGYGRQCPC